MSAKLYVGNIAFSTTEEELHTLFDGYGDVVAVRIVADRDTGRPRGFAFVEMKDEVAADAAVQGLEGTQLGGRKIRVSRAKG